MCASTACLCNIIMYPPFADRVSCDKLSSSATATFVSVVNTENLTDWWFYHLSYILCTDIILYVCSFGMLPLDTPLPRYTGDMSTPAMLYSPVTHEVPHAPSKKVSKILIIVLNHSRRAWLYQ